MKTTDKECAGLERTQVGGSLTCGEIRFVSLSRKIAGYDDGNPVIEIVKKFEITMLAKEKVKALDLLAGHDRPDVEESEAMRVLKEALTKVPELSAPNKREASLNLTQLTMYDVVI